MSELMPVEILVQEIWIRFDGVKKVEGPNNLQMPHVIAIFVVCKNLLLSGKALQEESFYI